jgi:hypothetical protein
MSEATSDKQISSYALTVVLSDPTLQGTPPAPSAYSTGGSSSTSGNSQTGQSGSSSPTPTGQSAGSNKTNPSNQWVIYAAIIIIVVVAVVITIMRLPKRKPTGSTKAKHKGTTGISLKVSSKKPQGKVRLSSASLFKYFLRNWICL